MNIFCHPGVFNGNTLAPAVANLLNIDPATQPCFGINPGVPLKNLRKGRATRKSRTNPNSSLKENSNAGAGKNLGALEPALSSAKGLDSAIWALEAPTTLPPTTTDQTLTDRTEIDLQLGSLFLEAKLTESNFQTAAPRLIERYRDLETVFDITRLPRKQTGAIQGYQLIRNVLAAFASDASFCVLSDARRRDLIEIWYGVLSAVHSPTFATRLKLLTWQELSTTLPKDLQQFLEAKYGIVPADCHYSGKTSEVRG
jgi:hypothetical protein